MASKGIEIPLVVNANGVVKGASDAEDALDKVADSLDDLARDTAKTAKRAGNELGDEIGKGAKQADSSLERVEKGFKELSSTARRETQEASDALDRNTKKGTSAAKRDLAELGNEAKQNASETFSSFDGSAASFADGIQGTLGGIVSSLGPIGAAAGAAGALGIGLIMKAIEDADEQAQLSREQVAMLAEAYIEAGGNGTVAVEKMVQRLRDLATETDENADSFLRFKKLTDESGLSLKKLSTLTGMSVKEVKEVWREADRAAREYGETIKEEGYSEELGNAQNAARAYRDEVGRTIGEMERAAQVERAWREAGGPELEAKAALIDSIGDSYDEARGSAEDFFAEDGRFDLGLWMTYVADHKALVEEYKANLELMKLSPEEWTNFLELPEAARMSIAENWKAGDQATKDAIRTTLSDAAASGGLDAGVAFDNAFSPKTDVDVKVSATTEKADTALGKVSGKKRTAVIGTRADTAAAENALNALTRRRSVALGVDAYTDAAERAIDRLTRDRRVTVFAETRDARTGRQIF
ncbi:hypothetical protein [Agromyces atrinae]|uniref:AraC-like DNA-binding protein/ElaB/YqjD/DUF883 family membrane-anchored ribosome-binding protein n=1 Tax=Agromyces atrinae TaxID=592376 RepID=A0A4V1R289_9MICO|nr:hypothetical protein [Agromyces atrinae]NYD65984.1 AraC-like DNA-binding protein/ElaB/YqjD/DUF883 family membrane-anchored ribosome-binding protein [Agromyces atrinae]RXZ86316.1 hypothetical protein ESP50_11200 [Agromyces atrinae]